mmetsp:Transcript_13110/g.22134  ORF Transcript_13110/g.22134 Transcript_13110/m.22134 type:complete len:122 (+) Transcript_13110:370-735(+)
MRIAYDILKKENPNALNKAENLLRQYEDTITKEREGKYPFVECVTEPDDSKRRGGGWQSTWHFDDIGFSGDGGSYDFGSTPHNITMAMPDLYNWLSGEDVSETFTYKTIMKHVKSEVEGQS